MANSSKRKSKTHKPSQQYDIQFVRDAARGQWPSILSQLAGVDPDSLDGKHHPCPRCSGTDRFRFTDRDSNGSALCNQCGKWGDGFGFLQFLLAQKFGHVLRLVADHLGIEPTTPSNGKPRSEKEHADPAEHLEWLPWSEYQVALWCLTKPPIVPAAIQAVGGRLARYRNQFTVIALPIWNLSPTGMQQTVGWCLYNVTGGVLPARDGDVKVKLTRGSQPGLIGEFDRLRSPATTTAWKAEGPSDLLAAISQPDIPADHAPWTNANGAKENPFPWVAEFLAGKTNYTCHDADQPGQLGALGWTDAQTGRHRTGWAEALGAANVVLPFPVQETHGKDLRDYFQGGGNWAGLIELAAAAEPMLHVTPEDPVNESVEDPYRLARVNLARYTRLRTGATLAYWQKEWFKWIGPRWAKIEEAELRAKVTAAVKEEYDAQWRIENAEYKENKADPDYDPDKDKGPPVCRKVSHRLVSDVLHAMAAIVIIPNSQQLDTWMDGDESKKRNCISLENGILDIDLLLAGSESPLLEHSSKWFSLVSLPYKFDTDAECPKWGAFLQKNMEGDADRIAILQEWAGYLLMRSACFQKFLMMEGDGSNGKSVFMAGIEAFIGRDNSSHVPLEAFAGEFRLYETLGKLVNIVAECSEMDAVAEGNVKAFASGDPMSFNRKGLKPIETRPTARLMVSANVRPRFTDRSQGLWRRMLIIPWRVKIADEEKVIGMDDDAWWMRSGELPGILNWAIRGLYQLLKQNRFTRSSVSDGTLVDYQHEMNPARSFLVEHYQPSMSNQDYVKTATLYDHYKEWALESGYKLASERTIGREVARTFPEVIRSRTTDIGQSRFYVYRFIKYYDPPAEQESEQTKSSEPVQQEAF